MGKFAFMETENVEQFQNRDPNDLNKHLQVMWDDIVGEPEGIRSVDCAWNCSQTLYKGCKSCSYILMSLLLAPFVAMSVGITFACMAFTNIWCFTPFLRICKITCAVIRNYMTVYCYACYAPGIETCGLIYSKIRIKHKKLPDGEDESQNLLIV